MPGAPPTSTSEPRTAPPPSTLSNSDMPVSNLSSASLSRSLRSMGDFLAIPLAAGPDFPFGFASSTTSLRVFHAPQEGHFPAQLGVSKPQSEQQNTVFCFMFSPSCRSNILGELNVCCGKRAGKLKLIISCTEH